MTIAELAEAIKNEINTQAWGHDFTATREYKPIWYLENLDTDGLQVSVVPRKYTPTRITRSQLMREDMIDISILKRETEPLEDTNEKDKLVALAEAITNHFNKMQFGVSVCKTSVYDPLYAPESLRKDRVFFGIITLTFTGIETA